MDDFIRRMLEQHEMVKRFKEGPAKFVHDNEAIITRMQGLEHKMHTSNIERAVVILKELSRWPMSAASPGNFLRLLTPL